MILTRLLLLEERIGLRCLSHPLVAWQGWERGSRVQEWRQRSPKKRVGWQGVQSRGVGPAPGGVLSHSRELELDVLSTKGHYGSLSGEVTHSRV